MYPKVGDRVGLRNYQGRTAGVYVVRNHIGEDVEIQCTKTGRRMVVLVEDLIEPPRFSR